MSHREEIIKNYIDAYNNFDVNRMVRDFDASIRFENITAGKTTLIIEGLENFRMQAEEIKKVFLKRKQTIKSFTHSKNQTEIEITYSAHVAADLPGGLRKGDTFNLTGQSVFKFAGNKIVQLTDIS